MQHSVITASFGTTAVICFSGNLTAMPQGAGAGATDVEPQRKDRRLDRHIAEKTEAVRHAR
jgi:hypothetical protein